MADKDNKKYGSMFRSKSMVYDQNIAAKIREITTEPEPETFKEKWHAWPKTVFSIFGTEFCERFTFYGIKTSIYFLAILTIYAINILMFDEDSATVLLHAFTAFAYLTPIIGSIIADAYIGKFYTIFFLSLLYAVGNIVLSVSAGFAKDSNVHPALDIVALMIIAFGTGGIKPCVSAFGADQFKIGHEKLLSTYFFVFYFSVNSGSTVSTFLTPMFRSQQCMGKDSCYPLAFGVPAGLMLLACAFFLVSSYWYKKYPPKENILLEVCKAMWTSLRNRTHYSHVTRRHWMDHYLDDHECDEDPKCYQLGRCQKRVFVDDIKMVLKIIVMIIPCCMFWALFDQQGSRWTIQAMAMDNQIGNGGARILPDQMQVANAVMILIFIPIFQIIIYPLVSKCINLTPLRKMTVGGLLTSVAFVVSAIVQFQVNKTMAQIPSSDQVYLSFINSLPCNITLESQYGAVNISSLNSTKVGQLLDIKIVQDVMEDVTWKLNVVGNEPKCTNLTQITTRLIAGKSQYTVITNNGVGTFESDTTKSKEGAGHFKISINYFTKDEYAGTLFLCGEEECNPGDPDNFKTVRIGSNHSSEFVRLKPGNWRIWIAEADFEWPPSKSVEVHKEDTKGESIVPKHADIVAKYSGFSFEITGQGGIYTLTLTSGKDGELVANLHTIVPENDVSILWQLPQYALLTAAEIMFSVTGLEFAYSQAPPSMKSIAQAIWLMSVAFGDIIVMIIAEIRIFENLGYEMLLFAGLMFWDMVIFIILATRYYQYTYYTRSAAGSLSKSSSKERFDSEGRFPRVASRATMPSISEAEEATPLVKDKRRR